MLTISHVRDVIDPGLRQLEMKHGIIGGGFIIDRSDGALYVYPGAHIVATQKELDAGLTIIDVSRRVINIYDPGRIL